MSGDITVAVAVIDNGKINVRTISPTAQAAMINWLVVEAGAPIYQAMDDNAIERLWDEHHGTARVARVKVAVIDPAAPIINQGDRVVEVWRLCTVCNGEKTIIRKHRWWSPMVPPRMLEIECPGCNGEGAVPDKHCTHGKPIQRCAICNHIPRDQG